MPADGVVSVIVTTRNSERTLEPCLDSVRRQTYPRVELLVVDNHSTDGTIDIAGRYADRVATIGPERSAQRNHGAAMATGMHLLFIDSDMVLESDVVAEGLEALRRSGLPAAVIPENTVGEGFWTRCRILERSCYAGDDTVEAARLYTHESFVDAGGFDAELNGGEDWDLSRRVAAGRRLPRARAAIWHDEGRTRLRTVYAKRRYYAPGYLRYLRKHGTDALSQGNPILRAAYLRHWKRLVRQPVLTAGMIALKAIEATAVLQVAVGQKLSPDPTAHGASGLYAPSPPRTAKGGRRPAMIAFGSILQPDGGNAVRSRVLAESLTALASPPAIVSTREQRPFAAPAWCRSLSVPERRPKWAFSVELVRLIRHAAGDSDLVILASAMFMPALSLSRVRLPMVWDTIECQTLHYRRLAPTASNRLKGLVWLWLERWAARRCQVAVAISDAEAAEWRRIHPQLRGKLVTVDHSAYAATRRRDESRVELMRHLGAPSPGPVLVFVGTMTAKHNAAAGRWILDVLAPSLPATTTVVLCGRGSDRLTPGGGGGARLLCLGHVDDVDSIIAAADLCLAPLASGAGVKTKVLHYLAHGRRVAGTPVAFEGLAGAPGLLEADLDALPALVARVCADMENAEVAQTRSAAQRAWMDCNHGLQHVAGQWNDVLKSLSPL